MGTKLVAMDCDVGRHANIIDFQIRTVGRRSYQTRTVAASHHLSCDVHILDNSTLRVYKGRNIVNGGSCISNAINVHIQRMAITIEIATEGHIVLESDTHIHKKVVGQHGIDVTIAIGGHYSVPELQPVIESADNHALLTLDDGCLRVIVTDGIVAVGQLWLSTTGIGLTLLIRRGNLCRREDALLELHHRGGIAHETTISIAVLA